MRATIASRTAVTVMIDAIIQDRFTCVSKPATMRSPVLLRPVGQWIGAGSGSSDSFSPRPTAFQIGGDPSCESPQRGQKHDKSEESRVGNECVRTVRSRGWTE